MDLHEQANLVVDRIAAEYKIEFSVEQRAQLVLFFAALAQEYPAPTPDDGAGLISAERSRQIKEEGWSSSHDDQHKFFELGWAALCYLQRGIVPHAESYKPTLWPWDGEWWKPSTDRIRNLVKAGALIAAEIDRLKRIQI